MNYENKVQASPLNEFLQNAKVYSQSTFKYKLDRIADLFEYDVLNDQEALNAFKKVIEQHSRTRHSGETSQECEE